MTENPEFLDRMFITVLQTRQADEVVLVLMVQSIWYYKIGTRVAAAYR